MFSKKYFVQQSFLWIYFLNLSLVASLAIILFATFGSTHLFDIDFFVAYQIMTLGQCLCSNSEKKRLKKCFSKKRSTTMTKGEPLLRFTFFIYRT